MRIFYKPDELLSGLVGRVGGLLTGPAAPEDEGGEEERAAARAREEEKSALRRRRGRSSTLFAGQGGGLASRQIGVRRSTLGGG